MEILFEWPNFSHNSSAICGAKGEINIVKDSKTSRLLHFWAESSFTQIINAEIDVLKLKFSISSVIFLMVLILQPALQYNLMGKLLW